MSYFYVAINFAENIKAQKQRMDRTFARQHDINVNQRLFLLILCERTCQIMK